MKRIITCFLVFFCGTGFAQQSFFYKLMVKNSANIKLTSIYVAYDIGGIKFKDSLDVSKRPLLLQKTLSQPVAATIYSDNKKIAPVSVMLANNNVIIEVCENALTMGESKLQDDFLYLTANDRIRPGYFPLYGELTARNDTAGLNRLGVIFDSLKKDDINRSLAYFKANPTSLLSLYSFNRYTTFFADYSKVEEDFALLPAWARDCPDGTSIKGKIEGAKSAQVNTLAKPFVQRSSTGQNISLEAFLGKYVLLDFWASWCAPCRKEHPNLIRTYEQFKEKNFAIISVSLDDESDNWLKAIEKDKITWTQISDLRGQLNEIAILYGVQSVPANFLIDPRGIIIDKNLTGEELSKKLKLLLEK